MAVPPSASVQSALAAFANRVRDDATLGARIASGPEDQLKRSVASFVEAMGTALGRRVSILSESPVTDVGRPDLAIAVDGLLVGYIELKAPGEGTTRSDFKGRNLVQLKRFLELPNLIYTDSRDWSFYREGRLDRSYNVRLGEIDEIGASDVAKDDADDLLNMFREFLKWEPIVPKNPRALAEQLAPITKMIRGRVEENAARESSALAGIYADWQRTLFPEATPEEFADSYAQTMTYGLLLAKLSGAVTLETHDAAKAIEHHSSLLARTLQILTQSGTRDELGPGLQLLERTIDAIDPAALRSDGQDPWLYFYEDFLAAYDPKLRNERGVYYTPAEVVKAQVTLVDELLRTKLGKHLGVADQDVTVLDPATGTGTYLLQTLQQGVANGTAEYGPGSAGSIASQMAQNLYGFELLVGPYAVAHLRLNQAVMEAGGQEPKEGVNIFLTDTLESPNEMKALPHSYFEKPLAEERERARKVKGETPILVCIGNPPYEREENTGNATGEHTSGSWIRFGDRSTQAPLESFIEPARQTGAGLHIKNLYNLYVYFWRWALWKVFESQDGAGIVSFITASSFLRGPGFVGMREELRRTFDDMWIIDLEGGSLGSRKSENVFDIRTPVAIAIGVRYGASNRDNPSRLHVSTISGSRSDKLHALREIQSLQDLEWTTGRCQWQDPLSSTNVGDYFGWPSLTTVFPWQHSGVQLKRLWPIDPSRRTLEKRWRTLLQSQAQSSLFRETRDRRVSQAYPDQLGDQGNLPAIASLSSDSPTPEIVNYAFRSFDRQVVLKDTRVGDRNRPPLWKINFSDQIYITSMLMSPLGLGPAIVSTISVPDLHHFRGSYGGKDVIPLYRGTDANESNITHGLLDLLSETYRAPISPEDFAGYITAILGHPGYTEKFHDELEVPGPRVPMTKDAALFRRAADLGKQVIAWQTYAERFPESIDTTRGNVPRGAAQIKIEIPDDPELYPQTLRDVSYDEKERALHVGEGVISGVGPRVWNYEVSGLRVVRSWLGYRVKERSGRKSSPLDDIRPERWTWEMTRELLALLWVLEGVIALEPAQAELLNEIVASDLFLANDLPAPTDAERKAPKIEREQQQSLF